MRNRCAKRLILLLVLIVVLIAYMVALASSAPRLRSLTVRLGDWPPSARPLRLVLISDLHVSRPGDSPARLKTTVTAINALRPDLVLIAGDFIARGISDAHAYRASEAIAPLADLKTRLGVFAILGNHDYTALDAVRLALARSGVHLLDNSAARVGPAAIIGVSDIFSKHAHVPEAIGSWRKIGGVPIVITHSPDVIPALPSSFHLVFAGHTHCGQVRLPLLGAPITQSRYGQRYGCGVIKEGQRVSVITAGLGTSSFPIRLGAAPDMWLVTIER